METTNERTLALAHPVAADGGEVAEVTMRRPKVRDSRDASKGGGSPAEIEIRLFANLCGIAPETVEDMDMADYVRLPGGVIGAAALDATSIDRAAVLVAHVLHTPMTDLLDAYVDDVLGWAEAARAFR